MGKLFTAYKKLVDGGPPGKESPKDYAIAYSKSLMYKNRLALTGVGTKPQGVKDLQNTKFTYTNSESAAFPKQVYKFNTNRININQEQAKQLGLNPDELKAHEFSHITRQLSRTEEENIFNRNKSWLAGFAKEMYSANGNNRAIGDYLSGFSDNRYHDARPDESKADLDALRYQLYKKGIYDTSKGNLDQNTFNKAMEDPDIKNSFTTKRLLENFKPEDIVQMNNTIASTNTGGSMNNIMSNGGNMTTKPAKKSLYAKMRKMDNGGVDNSLLTDQYGNVLPDTGSKAWETFGQKGTPGTGLSASAISGGASLAGGLLDAAAPADSYGVKSNGAAIGGGALKGAATGAALGSVVPGVGTVIGAGVGALVGGVTGLLGNKSAQKAKAKSIMAQGKAEEQMRQARSGSIIAADPDLKYGNRDASYYAIGGTMKGTLPQLPRTTKPMAPIQPKQRVVPSIAEVPGRQISRFSKGGITPPGYDLRKLNKPFAPHVGRIPTQNLSKMEDGGSGIHIKKSHEGLFTKYKERTGKTTEEALDSSDPHVRKMAQFAKNAAGWKKGAAGGEVFKTTDPSYKYPQYVMGANGGDVKQLSAGNSKVEGRSHANGGVKFPAAGVELEGDETMNGDFVFSKKLGFAQQHEKVARAIGRTEKKPDTVINRNTLNALQRQTEALKVQQESTKKSMGLPNEIDNQSQQTQMAKGGKLPMPNMSNLVKSQKNMVPKGVLAKQPIGGGTSNSQMFEKGGSLRNKMKVMAIGGTGDPVPGKPKYNITQTGNLPANNDPYWKEHPLETEHDDGTIRLWGEKPKPFQMPTTMKDILKPKMEMSDKALGNSSTYYPANSIPVKPSPATIYPSQRYKNGGKLKKMDTGGPNDTDIYGTGELPLASAGLQPYSQASLSNLSLPGSVPAIPNNLPPAGQRPKNPNGLGKSRLIDKVNDIGDKLVPFLPNIYEAGRKLPLPPTPVLESEIAPNLVDYSASRAEAVRQTRGANKAAEETLNTGAAVAAARAANLAGQERAVAGINEAEQTTNAGIRNQTNQVNLAVKARNNSLLNQHQQELTQRQLKSQELAEQNLASISEKVQGMKKDASAKDLDEQRLMIEALKDNTGASYRGAKAIFARNLNKDDMAQLDKHFKEMADMDREDRMNNTAAQRSLVNKILRGDNLSDADKTVAQILLGKSAVNSQEDLKKAKQASTKSSEQN